MDQEETTEAGVTAASPAPRVAPLTSQPQQALSINTAALPAAREMMFAAPQIMGVLQPAAYERVGQVILTEEEIASLAQPVPDDEIEIRPDHGIIYVSHEYIRRRLNEAFNPMQWTLIPGSPLAARPKSFPDETPEYFQRWVLFIHGVYCSEALGSRPVYEKKKNFQDNDDGDGRTGMSIDDAAEAIKSDCLRRCAKDLGLGLQAWSKKFQREWRRQFAIAVKVRRGQNTRTFWRRIDDDPFVDWTGNNAEITSGVNEVRPYQSPQPVQAQKPRTPQPTAVVTMKADKPADDVQPAAAAATVTPIPPATKPVASQPIPIASIQPQTPAGSGKLLPAQSVMLTKRLEKAFPDDKVGAMHWLAEWLSFTDYAEDPEKLGALIEHVPATTEGFRAIVKAIDAIINKNKDAQS